MFKQINYILLIGFCAIFSVLFSLALLPLTSINYWKLLIDGFINASTFVLLSYLVQLIREYGNYSALTLFQRIVNFSAIGLLALAILLAIGYGVFYLFFGENDALLLLKTIWIKGFIAVIFYLLVILYFHYRDFKDELSAQKFEDILDKKSEEQSDEPSEVLERIAVKSGQKIDVVLISEIIYLQAEGDYVRIFTEKGKYLKEETMKYFQENLPQKQFVRIHRSYIVNVEKIQRIDVYEKQNQLITLKNGERIRASIAGYKQLKSVLNL